MKKRILAPALATLFGILAIAFLSFREEPHVLPKFAPPLETPGSHANSATKPMQTKLPASGPHWPEGPSVTWRKLHDLNYEFTSDDDLRGIAVDAAIEVYKGRRMGDVFTEARGGDPVRVLDDCNGYDFAVVPLYVGNQYAGRVVTVYVSRNEVQIGVIEPFDFPSAQASGIDVSQATFPAVSVEDAHKLIGEDIEVQYSGLVHACAGAYPLGSLTAPFHAFVVEGERILVNSMDGSIATEEDVRAFEESGERASVE